MKTGKKSLYQSNYKKFNKSIRRVNFDLAEKKSGQKDSFRISKFSIRKQGDDEYNGPSMRSITNKSNFLAVDNARYINSMQLDHRASFTQDKEFMFRNKAINNRITIEDCNPQSCYGKIQLMLDSKLERFSNDLDHKFAQLTKLVGQALNSGATIGNKENKLLYESNKPFRIMKNKSKARKDGPGLLRKKSNSDMNAVGELILHHLIDDLLDFYSSLKNQYN